MRSGCGGADVVWVDWLWAGVARLDCLWSRVVRLDCLGAGIVRVDKNATSARLALALDVPQDPDFARLAHHAAKHDLKGGLRPARVGEEDALLDHSLGRVRGDAPDLAVLERELDALPVVVVGRTHARMQVEADGVVAGDQALGRVLEPLRSRKLVFGRDEEPV